MLFQCVAMSEKVAALLRLDFAGRSTTTQPAEASFVHIWDFARVRRNNGRLAPPVSSDIIPAVHAFVTFLNTFAGIPGDATDTFARPFARIIDWASAQPQYYGETSLEPEHKVSFVEELFEDIGVQLKLAAARLQPVYSVKDLATLLTHTIQHGAKGFHLISAADHDYGRKQAARLKFEEDQIGAMVRRGSGTRADDGHSPDSGEPPAKKMPKIQKPFCPHYAAGVMQIESGNGSVLKCSRTNCPYPHHDKPKLIQELKRDKDKAKAVLLDVFTEPRMRKRVEDALLKL